MIHLTSESFLGVWSTEFMTGARRRPMTDTLMLGRAETGAELTMPGSPTRLARRLRVNKIPVGISLEMLLLSSTEKLRLYDYVCSVMCSSMLKQEPER